MLGEALSHGFSQNQAHTRQALITVKLAASGFTLNSIYFIQLNLKVRVGEGNKASQTRQP
jgi:hypothetical protein